MGSAAVRPYLPILCVMVIWGSMGVFSTYALAEFSPMAVLCLRSGLGALTLLPFALRAGLRPSRGEGGLLAGLALLGVVLCNYFYFRAIALTHLTSVAIIYALGPIVTAALAAVILQETIRQTRLIGMALAFLGVVALLLTGTGEAAKLTFAGRGEAAELLSVLCLAVYTIFSRRLKHTPAACGVFWMMAVSFAVTLPPALLSQGGINLQASPKAWLSILYLGGFCSGFGYLLQQRSIALVGASASAAFLNGISPITILTAAVFLQEPVSPPQLMCMAAILLGVALNAANRNLLTIK